MPESCPGLLVARQSAGRAKFLTALGLCFVMAIIWSSAIPLAAKEPAAEFLKGLRKRGYGEVAVDYLEDLQRRGDLPDEIADRFDYEMSLSLQLAAKQAISKRQRDSLLLRSEEHLNKYIKTHPEAAGEAGGSFADSLLEQGIRQVAEARLAKDPAAKGAAVAAARKALEEARARILESADRSHKAYEELKSQADKKQVEEKGRSPNRKLSKEEIQEQEALLDAQLAWYDARLKLARINFYLAESHFGLEEKKERDELIAKAKEAFAACYNETLSQTQLMTPIYAHAWLGRCEVELGRFDDALDIFDEVLMLDMNEPGKTQDTTQAALEPLLAEASYYNLMAVRGAKGNNAFGKQAMTWLSEHKSWNKQNGYQGITLELCKALVAAAEKADPEKKKAMLADATARLKESSKIPSEYQVEINLMLRDQRKGGGGDPATIEEAMAIAEDAIATGKWSEAAAAWRQLAALAEKRKDKAGVAALKKAVDGEQYAYYRAALDKMSDAETSDAKIGEALTELEQIAHEHADTAVGPAASSQSVRAALRLYAAVKAKNDPKAIAAALARLKTTADYTVTKWPDRPEADDARIALGQASLVRGELAAAIGVFDSVNPKSDRYPGAMFLSGQVHSQLYSDEKKKAEGTRDAKLMQSELAKAEQSFAASVASYQALGDLSKVEKPSDTQAKQENESLLRLAEVQVEQGKNADAAKLVNPRIDAIKAAKPEAFDGIMLRTFLVGVRSNLATGQTARAGEIATLLTDLGADEEAVNALLVSVARMLFDEVKKNQANVEAVRAKNDPLAEQVAEKQLGAANDLLGQLLERLSKRQKIRLEQKLYIAITAGQVGRGDVARQLYSDVLKEAESNPEFSKKNAAHLTRVRAELVGLLRQKGNFSQAKEQIDKLLAENPGAIPLLMEQGRIMQAWAERDPTKWPDAVSTWTTIRTRLGTAKTKTESYYESVYSAAYCLSALGEKDKEKNRQALQLLNAIYKLDAQLKKLPEWDQKYKTLIDKLTAREEKPAKAG